MWIRPPSCRPAGLVAVLALAAACSSEHKAAGSHVAGTARTASPPPPIDVTGLATSSTVRSIEAVPHRADASPALNGAPAHLRITFDQDSLPPDVHPRDRQLLIFPVTTYRELFRGSDLSAFDALVDTLEAIIARKDEMYAGPIPMLPESGSEGSRPAQVKYLEFQGGAGLRFVARSAPDSSSGGGGLFYSFQGLTSDSSFWLAFYYPVSTRSAGALSHADGPVSSLDRLAAGAFMPSLDTLDRVVASIRAGARKAASGDKLIGGARLHGSITYRERVALPANAMADIELRDVSRADVPAIVIARDHIHRFEHQVPVPFTLRYDPAAIDQRNSYAAWARITVDGRTWFSTETRYSVLTGGAPRDSVVLVLKRVGQ